MFGNGKRAVRLLLLSILAIAACDGTDATPTGSQEDEAKFRSRAQEMYNWLLKPSCDSPPGFDRRLELAEELRTVDRFEQQLKSAAASSHLQVAREDASFELERDGGCWEEYSSTVWAEKHVQMTQELVQTNLAQLQALAPSLSPLPTDLAGQQKQAAEFRYRVRNLLIGMSPQCPLSKSIPNGDLLGPALDVVAGLKDELADTVFANQFAIAEADAAYALSETLFDCAAPSNSSAEQLRQEMKEYARDQVAAIRPLMRAH